MTLKELIAAYFQYYAIQVYIVLGAVTAFFAIREMQSPWPLLASAALAIAVYPLAWYLLHRYVLHGRFLFRSKLTASMWKRVHFDHHQDPHNLAVLFGALYTTLPTILLVTGPVGWAIGGLPAALAGISAGLFTTCLYEFCHCIQHLSYKPKNKTLRHIKKLHMAHHFHNEQGNYGITNFFWDKLLGTYYKAPEDIEASETVFNLGYTEEQAKIYPWVARLTETPSDVSPRERRRQKLAS
jgi:sterol desaturase/sphingolipid hydroxylase (fatty acid hydroxylase superfamily)